MELKVKRLTQNAVLPKAMTVGAAGMDLVATSKEYEFAGNINVLVYGTGLAIEIPRGHVGLLFPRSSIYKTGLTLSNCVGVLDSDYRGEIKAMFKVDNLNPGEYNIGDRIVQLVIMPIPAVNITEVKELSNTKRGEGGFGSTNVK